MCRNGTAKHTIQYSTQAPRLFLRKTGDQLISAVYPIEALAIAHQNVYVIIPRHPELSIWTLQALLGSKLLTFLYRKGSLGQEGRMLAQLRIAGLYQLPFSTTFNHPSLSKSINFTQPIASSKKRYCDLGAFE